MESVSTYPSVHTDAAPPTPEFHEQARFQKLQEQFALQYEKVFSDHLAEKTIVIVPSLTMDEEILQKIDGASYYEERMLCLLMLLRMPHTHVVYITSMPVDPVIVDYYLHLLPGITTYHARQRLTLLSCFDASNQPLTQKILDRPRLLQRIRKVVRDTTLAHMVCFNVTGAERKLAVALQLPIYGCDPDLQHWGNKSNSRKIFKECGIPTPDGYEDLYSEKEIASALLRLRQTHPHLRKAVVKVNEGFSGDGNALFSFEGVPADADEAWIVQQLPHRLKMVAASLSYTVFMQLIKQEGGIVEIFIDGAEKVSPSVQCRVNPLGKVDIISTHDQMLGGESGQVYLGAYFPAHIAYAGDLGVMGEKIAKALKQKGVLGRFAVDFISVKEEGVWKHYAIEINLRKGGTTHPYLMLQFLTDGHYHAQEGLYYAANGQPRYYVCSDNLRSEKYKGLTPHDMIDIAMCNDLLYSGSSQEGVMFHLISALSQWGKLGIVCVGATPERANFYYQKTVEVLDREGGAA